MDAAKAILRMAWDFATHALGRAGGRYYFEDFVRVYPDGIVYDRLGRKRPASEERTRNFLNHQKFYRFAAQFVRGAKVADLGCGSGHGCALLREAGAAEVVGVDASRAALAFARERYGGCAEFHERSVTDLHGFADGTFDIAISSEVLEHLREYRKEDAAVAEMCRVVRPGGLVVIGTPNSEMLSDHGFSFDEIDALMRRHFGEFCLFENALIPTGHARLRWEERLAQGRTGVVVTEAISFEQTCGVSNGTTAKAGAPPGTFRRESLTIDTTLLHNTHSWVVVARRPG